MPIVPAERLRRAASWLRHEHIARRVATIAGATALLAIVAASDALHAALIELFRTTTELVASHPVAGPAAFLLFAAGSAMLAFFSSAALVPAALVAWGPWPTFALLWAGWVLGGAASYAAARALGRPFLAHLASASAFARWEERLSVRAPFALVLLFQLAVPSEVPGYVLGLARYPFRRYAAALALGELPFAAGAVFLGASFLERRTVALVAVGLAAALASFAAFRTLRRRIGDASPPEPRPSPEA